MEELVGYSVWQCMRIILGFTLTVVNDFADFSVKFYKLYDRVMRDYPENKVKGLKISIFTM